MKSISIGLASALLLIAVLALGAQKQDQVERQLKAAKNTELVDGNLKAAIEQYKKVLDSGIRPLAAQALIHMAECYRKLGDADSQKVYQRIVREYADQKEALALALARLGGPAGATARGDLLAWTGPNADNKTNPAMITWELTVDDPVVEGVSPDGRYAFGGNYGLYDFAAGMFRPFVLYGKDGEEEGISFSKDGKQLAYAWQNSSDDHFELRIVNIESAGAPVSPDAARAKAVETRRGNAPTGKTVFQSSDLEWLSPHDWTPDNKWIVVHLVRKDRTSQIALVSVTDGSFRVLKSLGWRGPVGMFVNPADARFLAFDLPASDTVRQRDVFIRTLDGSSEEAVVAEPTNDVVMGWSPDGRNLIFASEQASGEVSLRALPFGDGKAQGPAKLIRTGLGPIQALGLTRSGSLYYFAQEPANVRMRIAAFDFDAEQFVPPSIASANDIAGFPQDFSRDGKYVAYRPSIGGLGDNNNTLIIRSLENGANRELHPALRRFWNARWSPDGRSLLVSGWDFKGRAGIYRIDAQTGVVSLLFAGTGWAEDRPAWSTDGRSVYYIRTLSDPTHQALVVRDLASGKESDLFQREGPIDDFSVSPDGQHISITVNRLVSVIPAAGGSAQALARGSFLAWAPDSHSFVVRAVSGGNDVSRVSLEGQDHKIDLGSDFGGNLVVGPGGRIALSVATGSSESPPGRSSRIHVLENFLPAPAAAPQNSSAFALAGSPQQLAWVDRSGKQIEKVGPPANYGWPYFSPDGKRISIARGEADGSDAWILDLANGAMKRLTFAGSAGFPAWSPDGASIAFLSKRNGKIGLYVVKADGTGNEQLLLEASFATNGRGLSWSADSKAVVYTLQDPKTGADVWMIPLTGDRKPVALIQTIADEFNAQVSPDGKWLAYISSRTGQRKVYIRRFPEGSDERQVPVSQPEAFLPRWRADSKELYVTAQTGAGAEVAIEIRTTGSSIEFGVPQLLGIKDKGPITLDGRRFLVLKDAPASRK